MGKYEHSFLVINSLFTSAEILRPYNFKILLIAITILINSCKEDESRAISPEVSVTNSGLVSIAAGYVSIKIENPGNVDIKEFGIIYSETPNVNIEDGLKNTAISSQVDQVYTFDLQNLRSGVNYYVKGFCVLADMVIYSSEELLTPISSLSSFQPTTTWGGDSVYVTNSSIAALDPTLVNIKVGEVAAAFSTRKDFVAIEMPIGLIPGVYDIEIQVGNGEFVKLVTGLKYVKGRWIDRGDFPQFSGFISFSFVIANELYFGSTTSPVTNFQKYNPENGELTHLNEFPGQAINGGGFAIDGLGYVVSGATSGGYSREVWQYDRGTDNWVQKDDFPGDGRESSRASAIISFSRQGVGYFGLGVQINSSSDDIGYNDLWKYDPSSDLWSMVSTFPGTARTFKSSVFNDDNLYVGLGLEGGTKFHDWWQFNFQMLQWNKVDSYPGEAVIEPFIGSINKMILVGKSEEEEFNIYDPANNNWIEVASLDYHFAGSYLFSVDDKILFVHRNGSTLKVMEFTLD